MPEEYRGIFGEAPQGTMDQGEIPGTTPEGVGPNEDELSQSMLDQYPTLVIEQLKMDEKKVLKEIRKWYDQDSQSTYRHNFLKRCKDYHQAYLGYMAPTSFPWPDCSNIDLGIIEMAVDNIKSRFKMSTIGGKPAFSATPQSLGAETVRQDVQELMSSALDQQVEIEKVTDQIAQDTVELGNCIVKSRWTKTRKNVRTFEKQIIPMRFKAPFMSIFSRDIEKVTLGIKEVVEEGACVDLCTFQFLLRSRFIHFPIVTGILLIRNGSLKELFYRIKSTFIIGIIFPK